MVYRSQMQVYNECHDNCSGKKFHKCLHAISGVFRVVNIGRTPQILDLTLAVGYLVGDGTSLSSTAGHPLKAIKGGSGRIWPNVLPVLMMSRFLFTIRFMFSDHELYAMTKTALGGRTSFLLIWSQNNFPCQDGWTKMHVKLWKLTLITGKVNFACCWTLKFSSIQWYFLCGS